MDTFTLCIPLSYEVWSYFVPLVPIIHPSLDYVFCLIVFLPFMLPPISDNLSLCCSKLERCKYVIGSALVDWYWVKQLLFLLIISAVSSNGNNVYLRESLIICYYNRTYLASFDIKIFCFISWISFCVELIIMTRTSENNLVWRRQTTRKNMLLCYVC